MATVTAAPPAREQADDMRRRGRRPAQIGVARVRGWRRQRRQAGVAAHPGVEEPPLGRFDVVADHDADVAPAAARQREAAQGRRLEANQQRQQEADDEHHRADAPSR